MLWAVYEYDMTGRLHIYGPYDTDTKAHTVAGALSAEGREAHAAPLETAWDGRKLDL